MVKGGEGFPTLSTRVRAGESYGEPCTSLHPSLKIRTITRKNGKHVVIDSDGHEWQVTNRWCSVCRWPLHRLHPLDDDTHPTCRGGEAS